MHKKIKADLVSLAHSVLKLKNDEEIQTLYKKAQAIYEKLAIAKYLQEQQQNEAEIGLNNQDDFAEIENTFNNEITDEVTQNIENEINDLDESLNFEDMKFSVDDDEIVLNKSSEEDIKAVQTSLEEEFKEAITADEATKIFENATKENPVISNETMPTNRTLNDTLFKNNLQIGLNDRIAFVNQLFDGSQEDFNRVISQLNTFNSEEEAKKFLLKFVKPDYDWNNKQEFEERLLMLIERKFT